MRTNEEAADLIESVLPGYANVVLEKRLIEEKPEWLEFYTDKVPVILIDGVEHGFLASKRRDFPGSPCSGGSSSPAEGFGVKKKYVLHENS